MPSNRYYAPVPFIKDESIFLEKEEAHHLCHVMRTKVGEEIELVNGLGELAFATLSSIKKDEAELLITSVSTSNKPEPQIILAQAIPRLNRLEFIIEKGTELGVSSFWLFPSIHSEKENFSQNQQKRLEQLTISAMKQCGRLTLPSLLLKPSLVSWEKPEGTILFGDTQEKAPWLAEVLKEKQEPLIFFVGPEKGFHQKELAHLEKIGAQGVKLHQNILRVDTAPIVALSQLAMLFH
jgi:16S rRNA (uracil1498-N3)-methyltransferase